MSIFGCSKEKALHISRHFQGPFLCFFSSSRRNVSSFKNSKCNLANNLVNLDKHEIDTHGEEWSLGNLGVYRDIGRWTRGCSLRNSGGRLAHAVGWLLPRVYKLVRGNNLVWSSFDGAPSSFMTANWDGPMSWPIMGQIISVWWWSSSPGTCPRKFRITGMPVSNFQNR